ncbi:unnamed protein product [Xylocopa violacea]|uniref:Uncharacterized protein n=1 Tax=Xylocopa violacea TaxID=135666 RepID=A0ABP1ND35_XYLVO
MSYEQLTQTELLLYIIITRIAWEMCEAMSQKNSFIMERTANVISMVVTEMVNETYNRITNMADEMEMMEDEELILPNAENAGDDFEASISEENEEEVWEDDYALKDRNFIQLEYDKKVVTMTKAHSKWPPL